MGGEQHQVDGGRAEGDPGEGDDGGADEPRQELDLHHGQAGLPPGALSLFQTQLGLWFSQQKPR